MSRTSSLRSVYKKIVLTGGNSILPGFEERLKMNINKELNTKKIRTSLLSKTTILNKYYQPNTFDININTHKDTAYSAWKGAALLSEEKQFDRKFITKELFEEFGDSIVRRNFFAFNC